MTKRIVTLLAALLLALSCIPAALAVDDTPAAGAGYYYVYTENGKGLNVRFMPGGEKVGSLPYGSRIYVEAFTDDNWAMIIYRYNMPGVGVGDYACYVSRRFLVKNKPAPRTNPSTTSAPSTTTSAWSEITAEFNSSRPVTPYVITVRPTRVSGWVNLRWAPSKSAPLMATYPANYQLTVLQESKNWYQVTDTVTGAVGFVNKAFVPGN